eukprot:980109-Prorocentrum_minimum.AAC.1
MVSYVYEYILSFGLRQGPDSFHCTTAVVRMDRTVIVTSQYNGTYLVTFTPFKAGTYDIEVLVNKSLVSNVPVTQKMIAGGINAEYSYLTSWGYGTDVNAAIAASKAQSNFTVLLQAVDRYRNELDFGGDLGLLTSVMVRTSTGTQ